ncbi:MAG: MerR family transcriptional regulator [Acidithiobacillus sp.]|uniref:MerR family transcriptional regulator n=1 Tax=Acidithiobacillus sp. TaxID=1872118 RepID=UPI0025C6E1E9|nr:MerR family transcriptional regulator [Acidithiobacillus sp.]
MAGPSSKAKTGKLEPLPDIPDKRYFSISEAAQLCGVKAHVLRYWEQEFPQLRPLKRRGNRRYYQKHDLLLARAIRQLLYGEGYTIHGARDRLQEPRVQENAGSHPDQLSLGMDDLVSPSEKTPWPQRLRFLRHELGQLLQLCRGAIDGDGRSK